MLSRGQNEQQHQAAAMLFNDWLNQKRQGQLRHKEDEKSTLLCGHEYGTFWTSAQTRFVLEHVVRRLYLLGIPSLICKDVFARPEWHFDFKLPPQERPFRRSRTCQAATHIQNRNRNDPMVPYYALPHEVRSQRPRAFWHQGQLYDIMGVDINGQVLLRDVKAMHKDIRVEDLVEQHVTFRGRPCRVRTIDVKSECTTIRLVADVEREIEVINSDAADVSLRDSSGNNYAFGKVRHGIMRMQSLADACVVPVEWPDRKVEARLRGRELEGVFGVTRNDEGELTAHGRDRCGVGRRFPIAASDIAPRFVPVFSADFGSTFDVDTFDYKLDQARSTAVNVETRLSGGRDVVQDPLFGGLANSAELRLTSGIDHLAVFEEFIRRYTSCGPTAEPRTCTVFNISMSPQGDANVVLKALIEFRRVNPNANIVLMVSKLGPTEFQESTEFQQYLARLAEHSIEVDMFTGAEHTTRQVVHGKGIAIDDSVLFSTGSVMDTKPINKADLSLELPPHAAAVFRRYMDEAMHRDASFACRSELAAELAQQGVVINDPVAGLPYISRLQDALIRGVRGRLLISISELRDPIMTRKILERVVAGVEVNIHIREIDAESRRLLENATLRYPNVQLHDSSTWEPRPHFNLIIADGQAAYVGTSYLWPTQCNFLHQGRSFENGLMIKGFEASRLEAQILKLYPT